MAVRRVHISLSCQRSNKEDENAGGKGRRGAKEGAEIIRVYGYRALRLACFGDLCGECQERKRRRKKEKYACEGCKNKIRGWNICAINSFMLGCVQARAEKRQRIQKRSPPPAALLSLRRKRVRLQVCVYRLLEACSLAACCVILWAVNSLMRCRK